MDNKEPQENKALTEVFSLAVVVDNSPRALLLAVTNAISMGIEVDEQKNAVRGEEALLSTPNSKVTVCVIPTDEEWMIASDTMHLV